MHFALINFVTNRKTKSTIQKNLGGSMKKSLLVVAVLLFLGNLASAQVLERFESAGSLGIFKDAKWGTLTDSIYQTTFKGSGVLAFAINTNGQLAHNAIRPVTQKYLSPSLLGDGQVLTFWVFIPDTATPNINVQLWWQPANGWTWTQVDNHVQSIPKNIWYPLSVCLKQTSLADPTGHDLSQGIGDFGIQLDNDSASAAVWKGVIYVDNVSLIGATPTSVQSFHSGLGKFKIGWSNGWTDSLFWTAGPIGNVNGALGFTLKNGSASTGNAFAANVDDGGSIDASGQNFLVCWVWADTTLPDSAQLLVYAQDRSNWTDPTPFYPPTYYGKDIPKQKWYPIYFDIAKASILDSVKFNPWKNHFGWFGLYMGGRKVDSNFTVYMSKMEMINSVVIPSAVPGTWLISDFNDAKYHGWFVPQYTSGSVTRYLDLVTAQPGYVLQGSVALSPTAKIFATVRDSVKMINTAGDSIATDLYCDIYLPSKMPANGVVKFFASAGPTDSVAVAYTIGSTVSTVIWNTLHLKKLDSLAQAGKFDPTKKHRVGVAIYYPAPLDTTTWTGKIEIDNVRLVGFAGSQILLGVNEGNIVKKFALYDNYPNPFNPTTVIRFDVAKEIKVQIKVFDILGREVTTLVNGVKTAGSYEVEFNASKLTSGSYFVRMTAGDFVRVQKMILMK
jgi:hypothetical protein